MKNTKPELALAGAMLALLALLAGCGGSGGDGDIAEAPPEAQRVPASATASVKAFTTYVASLPPDDRAEPLDLDGVTPPTSETAEPEESV